MNQRFPSSEKLKSKILIDRLFSEGKSVHIFPVKLIYLPVKDLQLASNKAGVSVPKRSFKRAVDRNYLKRIMREVYRKNKYLVENNLPLNYAFMFIYTGKKIVDYKQVNSAMTGTMKKLIEKEGANEKEST